MKRLFSIYLIILLGLFVALAVLDRHSDYIVEKKIWKLYRQQIDIAKDPNVIPDRSFDRVINGYRKVIDKYPHSSLAPEIYIHIGEVYALRGDHEGARKVYFDLMALYPDSNELVAKALFKVGGTYEAVDNWSEANKIYQGIIRDYPLTEVGLNLPVYIADYYRNQNDFQQTMTAYEFAINQYTRLASVYENKRAGLNALRHLSSCYLDQNRWKEAMNTLGVILEKYSTSDYLTVKEVDLVIKTINITSAYQLKDYDEAIRLYEGIIDRNPGHPLVDYLNKVIDAFNQLKEKGVRVYEQ